MNLIKMLIMCLLLSNSFVWAHGTSPDECDSIYHVIESTNFKIEETDNVRNIDIGIIENDTTIEISKSKYQSLSITHTASIPEGVENRSVDPNIWYFNNNIVFRVGTCAPISHWEDDGKFKYTVANYGYKDGVHDYYGSLDNDNSWNHYKSSLIRIVNDVAGRDCYSFEKCNKLNVATGKINIEFVD